MRMECKTNRKNWEKRDGDQINVGLLFNTMNKGGGIEGVLGICFCFCVKSDFVVVGCAIPAYLLVNSVSAYVYAKLSYNQLCSLFHALRNEASGTNGVLDNIIFQLYLFSIHSLRLFLINRLD